MHVLQDGVPTKCKSSWKFWKTRGNFLFKVTTNLIYKLNLENVWRQTYVDVLTEARFLWNPATICFDLYREDLTVLRMPNASSLTYQSFLLSRRWQMDSVVFTEILNSRVVSTIILNCCFLQANFHRGTHFY